jgi:hypothetical protein
LLQHSIRPQSADDGFLLPYADLLRAEEAGAEVDWNRCLAFAPSDHLGEFAYATEHVSQDGAISALLECRSALEAAKEVLQQVDVVAKALRWIDSRIAELWKLRGPYPGLGAALSAFGVQHGNFLAMHLATHVRENDDPWPLVDKVMRKPASLPPGLSGLVTRDLSEVWKGLDGSRLALLKLLARFALTNEQAARFYVKAEREAAGLFYDHSQFIENPYLIYEADRFSVPTSDGQRLERVSLETIDRGAYPAEVIAETHPLPVESQMLGPMDKRRVRALVIDQLEKAAANGHTLLPRDHVILGIRNAKLEPPCRMTEDVLDAKSVAEYISREAKTVPLKGGAVGLQLLAYVDFRSIVSTQVENRALKAPRFEFKNDWAERLRKLLPPLDEMDADELRAREEKAAALAELASSRFSVLVGPAGAGKTTVLRALCKHEEISATGVLLLAPTGKARVQLSQKCEHDAQTMAQFLGSKAGGGRYNARTGSYRTVRGSPYQGCKTIIVDEASMCTEDMLGALFDAVKGSADRIILVGDPRQLPPIGAGRPFYDVVMYLTPSNLSPSAPRVGKGFAELTIQRRHKKSGEQQSFPVDLQLANWFSGRPLTPGEDEIWATLSASGDRSGRIVTRRFESTQELRGALLDALQDELSLESLEDQRKFACSYGGELKGDYVYFNRGAAEQVDNWQVLTPLRNEVLGARDINRLLHKTFRKGAIAWGHRSASRGGTFMRISPPRGPEEIVYGDKVMNVRNHRREYVSPLADSLQYVANGEIGVVVGDMQMSGTHDAPWQTKVEFSSQPGSVYSFAEQDFDEERMPLLELAYAVTVHKAQGSEFDTTILVLPKKHRLVSREMLYTALTRQQRRVVILHQGDLAELRNLASDENAVIPQRFTNLFEKQQPDLLAAPISVSGKWMDERLIHRSRRGTALRSKSEVIIDDALLAHGIDAPYEVPFFGKDGTYRLPDFTIQDASMGRTVLWEHCGMMADEGYKTRWRNKLSWYRENGVLPIEEGGGPMATLVVTYDDERGGIDGQKIEAKIAEIFG